ncbi:hypothetical protein ACFO25_16035 [Paenactinomyces guangxiensis]|uniref:Uncharacterized protein n=1 Tax=Paenactinomyces guangxiensis TaxID=1490290 RepID=A0A7W1WTP8_9BACL|nr:hypothetical protein [Paenactinomyces guangxiensis]MBA4495849.1 hypothetical protein [Paenactinomyces guangxiensis]MBH8593014.1 hypothetical protein [Paenactinomyces guangxiensis]
MLKAIIYTFPKERVRVKNEAPPSFAAGNNANLTNYWMIEGPRSYRQSILNDKIRSSHLTRSYLGYWI